MLKMYLILVEPPPTLPMPEPSVWTSPYIYAAFISSLIAAFLGNFVASFLKEYFADKFFKRKRIRELRSSLTKSISEFHPIYLFFANEQFDKKYEYIISTLKWHADNPNWDFPMPDDNQQGNINKDVKDQLIAMANFRSDVRVCLSELENYLSKKRYRKIEQRIRLFFERSGNHNEFTTELFTIEDPSEKAMQRDRVRFEMGERISNEFDLVARDIGKIIGTT